MVVFTPFEVQGDPVDTPFGPAGPIRIETQGDRTFLWISRRGDPRARVVAAKEHGALHALGLGDAIALPSPHSPPPSTSLRLGAWLVPSDALDQTRGAPTTFFAKSGLGYLSQSPPFCPETRAALLEGVPGSPEGIVVAAPERPITPAELRAWALLGGSLAMPGLAPEWYLCRELEIGYAPLCHVSWVEGEQRRLTEAGVRPVVENITAALPAAHSWEAGNAAARREFGEDWRSWI